MVAYYMVVLCGPTPGDTFLVRPPSGAGRERGRAGGREGGWEGGKVDLEMGFVIRRTHGLSRDHSLAAKTYDRCLCLVWGLALTLHCGTKESLGSRARAGGSGSIPQSGSR